MELTHNQVQWIRNQVDFSNVFDIAGLIKAINYGADKFNADKERKKLQGDAFEIFVEYFVKSFGNSNQVGIVNYKPNTGLEFDDFGVDGIGQSIDEFEPAAVQAKFRTNPKEFITYEEVAKFHDQAEYDYKVTKWKNHLVITTAFGPNDVVKSRYIARGGRIIGLDDLQIIIGPHNLPFWEQFRQCIQDSQKERVREIKERHLHQKEMVTKGLALLTNNGSDPWDNRGWIACGTGGGKTFVINDLSELYLNENRIVVIASPRIRLTEQIKGVMYSQKRIDYERITFHSGGKEELERFQGDTEIFLRNSTTSEEILVQWLATNKNKKIVVYTTYHSSLKLGEILAKQNLGNYLYLADECHNLVTNEFSNIVRKMGFKKFIGFTGTPNETRDPNGSGMNNRIVWGSCLHEVSAMELAANGRTVPPRVFLVQIKDDIKDTTDGAEQFEIDIVHRTIRKFKDEMCPNSDCKIIVTCSSVKLAHKMADTKALQDLEEFERCVVTSNKEKMGARSVVGELSKFKQASNTIIFHYDMLGEGIDVPSVSAVLPMRSLNTIKAIQNIGRANRLTDEDKRRLLEGKLEVSDRTNWNKPYAWLICPYVVADPKSQEAYRNMLHVLRMLRKQDDNDSPFVEEYLYIAEADPNENKLNAPNMNDIKREIEQLVAKDLQFELEKEEDALVMVKKARANQLIATVYEPSEKHISVMSEAGELNSY